MWYVLCKYYTTMNRRWFGSIVSVNNFKHCQRTKYTHTHFGTAIRLFNAVADSRTHTYVRRQLISQPPSKCHMCLKVSLLVLYYCALCDAQCAYACARAFCIPTCWILLPDICTIIYRTAILRTVNWPEMNNVNDGARWASHICAPFVIRNTHLYVRFTRKHMHTCVVWIADNSRSSTIPYHQHRSCVIVFRVRRVPRETNVPYCSFVHGKWQWPDRKESHKAHTITLATRPMLNTRMRNRYGYNWRLWVWVRVSNAGLSHSVGVGECVCV